MTEKIRLLLADDQALVRGALAALLELEEDLEIVATGSVKLTKAFLTWYTAVNKDDAVVARNPILQHLFNGAWVHLVAIDGDHGHWQRRVDGHWHPLPVHPSRPAAQETPA